MANVGYATLQVIPSLKGIDSSIRGQLTPAASAAGKEAGEKAGSSFGSALSTATKAVVGFAAATAVGQFFRSSFAEAQQSVKVAKQTEAVLKSTGGQAHVTAGQVNDLADSLSKKAGIDDEEIQAGENMLLTFRNVRNEAGKNNDIFNQATKATLDLAVGTKSLHGGQVDLKGASVLLGKALNDPVKGMTALRRVGVQLTDEQAEQIKSHLAVGDVLGAQKIILGEVTKEFGGSAAAQATAADKASVAWKNLQEAIGKALLPVINKLADIVTPFIDYLSTHQGVLLTLAGIIGGTLVIAFIAWAASAASAAVATLAATWPVIAAGVVVAALAAGIIYLWTHWNQIWNWMGNHPAYAILIGTFGTIITGGLLPIVLGIIWVAKNWDAVWGTITTIAQWAWDNVLHPVFDAIITVGNTIMDGVRWAWDNVGAPALSAAGTALSLMRDAATTIKTIWDGMFDGLRTAWAAVSPIVGTILDALGSIVQAARDVVSALGSVKRAIGGSGGVLGPLDPFGVTGDVLGGFFGASGAVVTRPTFSLIGEDGPEALVPLNRAPGASPLPDVSSAAPRGGYVYAPTTNIYPAKANFTAEDLDRQQRRQRALAPSVAP